MSKVSVCLPVFNGRRFLRAAIETVLAQTHKDFELLIADDCSTDDSLAIAEELAKRDKRIVVWKNPKNLGLFANYNACIERATGEYVKLFAQDDLLIPTNLETHLKIFAENEGISLITGSRNIIGESGQLVETLGEFDEDRVIPGDEVIESNLTRYCNWVGEPSCVSFPTKLRSTGFDTTLFHYGDVEYWYRILENGKLYYSSAPLCSFRRHEGSATRRNMRSLNFIVDLGYLADKYSEYLERKGVSREIYWERMVDTISPWVYAMVDDEGLREPDSADLDLIDQGNYDPETMVRVLKAIRYASMQALHKLTIENRRNQALVKDLETELFDTEEKLSNLLNSPVTRASSAVRNVLSRLGSKMS
jgi:glycosyltransferase involved in cell wall biosynthesis